VGAVGPGEYRPGPQPHSRMKCNPGRNSCNPRQLKGTQPPPPFAACAACTNSRLNPFLPGLRRLGRLGLGYASQREILLRRAMRREQMIKSNDPLESFPQKPRGMHGEPIGGCATRRMPPRLKRTTCWNRSPDLDNFSTPCRLAENASAGAAMAGPSLPRPPALHQLHLGRTGPIGPERRQ
jgi:hypothetical protein